MFDFTAFIELLIQLIFNLFLGFSGFDFSAITAIFGL